MKEPKFTPEETALWAQVYAAVLVKFMKIHSTETARQYAVDEANAAVGWWRLSQ